MQHLGLVYESVATKCLKMKETGNKPDELYEMHRRSSRFISTMEVYRMCILYIYNYIIYIIIIYIYIYKTMAAFEFVKFLGHLHPPRLARKTTLPNREGPEQGHVF